MLRQLFIGFAASVIAHAQSEVFGIVSDPGGLSMEGAFVTVVSRHNALKSTTITNSRGEYHFFALPAGPYELSAARAGFEPVRRNVTVRLGDRLAVDLSLALEGVAATVETVASSARATVTFHLDEQRVAALPLDGRNFVPLIALSPGVALPPGSVLPRINGSRPRVNEYIYDGISVLQPEPGQVAWYPVIDAIEEFRVDLNAFSAEYGRSNGGVILINQKRGGNEFHGALFEFFRNDALNARNLFAESGPRPKFKRNQYGLVGGGPLRRDRTFFFTEWQGTRLRTGVPRASTVPLPAERLGVFTTPIFDPWSNRDPFPANTIPASRFDPAAANLLPRYPEPTASGRANNYRRIATDSTNADQFGLRMDHIGSDRHRFFGKYTWLGDSNSPAAPLQDGSGGAGPAGTHAAGVSGEHTWTATPASVNQFRFGFTRRQFARLSSDLGPTFQIAGFQQLGPLSGSNSSFDTSVTQLVDTFSIVHGAHSIKAGADIRLQRLNVFAPPNPAGLYQFNDVFTGSSLASFLLGQVTSYTADVQESTLRPRASIAEGFMQDDWQAARRLVLNLGLRYTLNFPSVEANDRSSVFNLRSQQLDFAGRKGVPRSARNMEWGNVGPRIGLAYRVGDSFTVRSGYGLTWIEQAGITTPFTAPMFPFVQTISQSSLDNLRPAFILSMGPAVRPSAPNPDSGLGQGVFGVQRDQKSGYAQQWNLTLQTAANGWTIEGGYLGSKLTRLGVPDINLNQLRVEQLALGPSLAEAVPNPFAPGVIARQQLLRPYPRFTAVTLYRNNTGSSTYHAAQARIERRYHRGFTFSAAYTYSKLIDDAGAVFDSAILTGPVLNYQVADSFNRSLEKDVSTGNIPHVFSAGALYSRRGWQLAGLARLQAGSPVAVTQATNLNAFAGFGIQRPNLRFNPSLHHPATSRWFDTSAFTAAPQFTIGNASRNPVRGPGYRALDLMIGRMFRITEKLNMELRAEAFNVMNTPPLGNPNGSFGSPAFGTVSSALDPRVFELVWKLHF